MNTEINNLPSAWQVDRKIPIAMLFGVMCQLFYSVWWASSFSAVVSAKLDVLTEQISEMKAEKYTRDDARRDQALIMLHIEGMTRRLNAMDSR